MIISLALGTGLRLGEIVGLDVGDVYLPDGTPRTRVRLRAEIAKGGRVGDVFLPDALLPKLRRFQRYKAGRGESLEPDAPLLCSQSRWRISKRRVQVAFRSWQVPAGFDRLYGFHAARHYADSEIMPTGLRNHLRAFHFDVLRLGIIGVLSLQLSFPVGRLSCLSKASGGTCEAHPSTDWPLERPEGPRIMPRKNRRTAAGSRIPDDARGCSA